MVSKALHFYFDYISPYAFFAWKKIPYLAKKYDCIIELHPVVFGKLLDKWGQLGPAEIEPKRNWLHVSDTVSAIMKIIENGNVNNIYNISGNYEEQNIVIARKILYNYGIFNNEDNWIDGSEKRLGQDVRYSINDKKLKDIGWKPEAKFDKELKIIVDYYKKNFIW